MITVQVVKGKNDPITILEDKLDWYLRNGYEEYIPIKRKRRKKN